MFQQRSKTKQQFKKKYSKMIRDALDSPYSRLIASLGRIVDKERGAAENDC
jgi:hypothetical protein